MSGFDAGAAVEPLDWDFTKFGGGKGTIPEPSDAEMRGFGRDLARLTADLVGEEDPEADLPTIDKVGRALDQLDSLSEQFLDTIAGICKGTPTREQIEALPGRVQKAFVGWLVGQLLDPQLPTAGTTRSPAALRAV